MTVCCIYLPETDTQSFNVFFTDSKSFSSKTVAIKLDPLERATQVVTDVVVLSGSKKDQVPSGFSRLP